MKGVPSILLVCLLPVLAGCSMSPTVKSYSVDYADAMEAFSNEMIVRNILRAKEHAPLHFADLSQITGSIQFQASMGATFPFGLYAPIGKTSDQLTPGIQFQSSPTFNVSPLDTQSFTLNILQPIQSQYFARLFDDPTLDQHLLWHLFVSSIRDGYLDDAKSKSKTLRNDPTNENDWRAYAAYIDDLVDKDKKHATIRTLSVLVPTGPPFTIVGTQPPPSTPKTPTLTLVDVIANADEGTYHLEQKTEPQKTEPAEPPYTLYRRFDNQLALCGNWDTPFVLPPGAVGTLSFSPGGSSNPAKSSPASASKTNPGGSTAPAASTTPVLPLIGKVPMRQCNAPAYVFDPKDKSAAAYPFASLADQIEKTQTANFEIRLRSIREVVEYLGAIIASNADVSWGANGNRHLFNLVFTSSESTEQSWKANRTEGYPTGPDGKPLTTLYLDKKQADWLTHDHCKGTVRNVLEQSGHYSWGCATSPTDRDYTARVVALLSELINTSKVSADIATTKQVQVVP